MVEYIVESSSSGTSYTLIYVIAFATALLVAIVEVMRQCYLARATRVAKPDEIAQPMEKRRKVQLTLKWVHYINIKFERIL